jgi:hypothetical protein
VLAKRSARAPAAATAMVGGGETVERKLRQIYDAFDGRNYKVRPDAAAQLGPPPASAAAWRGETPWRKARASYMPASLSRPAPCYPIAAAPCRPSPAAAARPQARVGGGAAAPGAPHYARAAGSRARAHRPA